MLNNFSTIMQISFQNHERQSQPLSLKQKGKYIY